MRSRSAVPASRALAPSRDAGPGDLLSDETAVVILRHGVAFEAARRGMSARTLRREFQRAGVSLARHLAARRRVLAIVFLASGWPIPKIAKTLGFASTQTFARFVRREMRTTATELRRWLVARYGLRRTQPLPLSSATNF